MKIFVSWSGELSSKIAEALKKWIPCIVQSVDVFFSPEDIEKGNNWERILSTELSECKFGIICLTPENTSAPWLNFEAGAIAKSLDSKVAALMINIKPSDIKGPLSRYQATKLDKDDFYQLIVSINKTLEDPREESILKNVFDAMWTPFSAEINQIIEEFSTRNKNNKVTNSDKDEGSPIEEILQLLRKQNSILTNPENLFSVAYLEKSREINVDNNEYFQAVFLYFKKALMRLRMLNYTEMDMELITRLHIDELMHIIAMDLRERSKIHYMKFRDLEQEWREYIEVNKKMLFAKQE